MILPRLRLATVVSALSLSFLAALGALAPAANAYTVQNITPWLQNAAPVGWSSSLNRVIYNSLGANGLYNAYSANPDGSDPVCLTCTIPSFSGVGTATNRGAFDVSPNGEYMLVTVERDHVGVGAAWTQPGKGGANDVWLYTTDGQHAWPLTNIYAPGNVVLGTNWPRFDRTGNEIVWASLLTPAVVNLGYWQLNVANIVWSGGVPSLAQVRTLDPVANSFYEPYGFTPNDQDVIFATSAGGSPLGDTIDEINVNGTGLQQLSPAVSGGVTNYAEFAFYTPANDAIIWGRGYDTGVAGMDYWIMNPDGTNPQRLTFFNEPWSTEYLGYTLTGSLVFNPNNPDQFIAGVTHDSAAEHSNAVMVTLSTSPTAGEMTQQIYGSQNFQQLVSTTTQSLSDGFKTPSTPFNGPDTSGYSIRWLGNVSFPASGTYQLCVDASVSAQLYVVSQELVNASYSYGKRECEPLTESAGSVVPVAFDYEQSAGSGYAQLSWITPGATAPVLIPSNLLTPAQPGAAGPSSANSAAAGNSSAPASSSDATAGETAGAGGAGGSSSAATGGAAGTTAAGAGTTAAGASTTAAGASTTAAGASTTAAGSGTKAAASGTSASSAGARNVLATAHTGTRRTVVRRRRSKTASTKAGHRVSARAARRSAKA